MSECFDVNSISCTLIVDMDQAPRAVPGLLNHFEQPGAKLISCQMNSPATFTNDDFVDLTPVQLSSKACVGSTPLPATICASLAKGTMHGCEAPISSAYWLPDGHVRLAYEPV